MAGLQHEADLVWTTGDAGAARVALERLTAEDEAHRQMYADDTADGDPDARSRYLQRRADIAARRTAIEATSSVREVTQASVPFDWTADPADVNADLHRLFQYILLNGGMLPKRAVTLEGEEWPR